MATSTNEGHQDELVKQLLALLEGKQAHADFDTAVKGLGPELWGRRPENLPHSAWQLVEHIRIAQRDILDFSTNREGEGYKELRWPEEYWPKESDPPSATAWEKSLDAFRQDMAEFRSLLQAKDVDLHTPLPWGDGQTLLREVLLVADHTAYHVGELVLLRRLLGAWKG